MLLGLSVDTSRFAVQTLPDALTSGAEEEGSMKRLAAIACVALVAFSAPCNAKGSGHSSGGSHASTHSSGTKISSASQSSPHRSSSSGKSVSSTSTRRVASRSTGASRRSTAQKKAKQASSSGVRANSSRAAPGVQRDSHGKIARSEKAKDNFEKSYPCPSTGKSSGGCPGYVIDHIRPLKRGGADSPSNMQWQTTQQARIKDRTE